MNKEQKPTEEKKVEKEVVKTKKVEEKTDKKDHTASVNCKDLVISTKFSVEVANFIRNKKLQKAKDLLSEVILKKTAVPINKYNKDVAHKPGMAAGRYPVKVSKAILTLLNSVESNAEDKGLSTENLIISEIIVNGGSHQMHHGRHSGRRMKRTHVSITVREAEE
ncbi:50S ribosomal protein L22 [archaeon]|jgi:large subunit ribosomal protein L22|nr:50S ribosomal protein L22 [archaeon]MBT6823998.1 50S ribosomal protein L22 [archaeon]MBT7107231.1 50S ribosomal protein L22 [archaeon]MBT7297152.1 50S ribosomal protein L22 [archaeon]